MGSPSRTSSSPSSRIASTAGIPACGIWPSGAGCSRKRLPKCASSAVPARPIRSWGSGSVLVPLGGGFMTGPPGRRRTVGTTEGNPRSGAPDGHPPKRVMRRGRDALLMTAMTDNGEQTHVVIVGGGFAGLGCARRLAGEKHVRVTLIDQHNYHQFQPLLYQVATAQLAVGDIALSLRSAFHDDEN